MAYYLIRFVTLVIFILISTVPVENVYAQQPEGKWAHPIRITESGNFARYNSIVADLSGNLHAIWSEGGEGDGALDTVYYATWNDTTGWSTPVDIFAAPIETNVKVMRLRVDSDGNLHALWIGKELMYARVHVSQAMNVRAWEVIRIREPAFAADLAIDETGHQLNIVYAIQEDNVYSIQSLDGGYSWSDYTRVWIPQRVETTFDIRLERFNDGTLHTVWEVHTAARNWDPDRIEYARSLDGGKTWVDHYQVLEPSGQASIGFDKEGGIHLFWNNPVWDNVGRFHIWSRDGGITWTPIERLFPGYKGLTKFPALAQDSAGVLHLVFAANSPRASNPRIFHTYWQGSRWAEPQIVQSTFEETEGPTLAIRGGNELHVLWFSYTPKDHGIWYTSMKVDAPRVAFDSVPTPETITTTTKQIPTPTNESQVSESPSLIPTPARNLPLANEFSTDTNLPSSPALPIIISILSVAALISLILFTRIRL